MASTFPPELLTHIISCLSISDAYLLRAVNTHWKHCAEQSIYHTLRATDTTALVRLDTKNATEIVLHAHSYDDVEGVIEFRSNAGEDTTQVCSGTSTSMFPRAMQVLCSYWLIADRTSADDLPAMHATNPLYLFHGRYNPAVERLIPTPPWNVVGTHLIGDTEFILSFTILPGTSLNPNAPSASSTPTAGVAATGIPPPPPPYIRVNYLRVTPSWLISGTMYAPPYVHPTQIYPARYALLTKLLMAQGVMRYDLTCEPVLRWIVSSVAEAACKEEERDAGVTLSADLVATLQQATHDFYTRTPLAQLVHTLEHDGIEPRALWKYGVAKRFVTGIGLVELEQVVRSVQDNEAEAVEYLAKLRSSYRSL